MSWTVCTLQLNKEASDLWLHYMGVFVRNNEPCFETTIPVYMGVFVGANGPCFETMTPVYGRICKE
jgi:hypothetical protein